MPPIIQKMKTTTGSLFDVASWTGLDLRHIPRALRDENGFADTRSWAVLFNDAALARRPHELLFGTRERFGDFYFVSGRHVWSIMSGHCYRYGSFGITLVESAQHRRCERVAEISSARAQAGKRSGEARSGGTSVPPGEKDVPASWLVKQ